MRLLLRKCSYIGNIINKSDKSSPKHSHKKHQTNINTININPIHILIINPIKWQHNNRNQIVHNKQINNSKLISDFTALYRNIHRIKFLQILPNTYIKKEFEIPCYAEFCLCRYLGFI